MKKQGIWGIGSEMGIAGLTAMVLMIGANSAHAARLYQFSGKVTGVRGDTIAVSHGLQTMEFGRDSGARATRSLDTLKVGDEVTIWYKLEAQKAAPAQVPSPGQQPGQVAPDASPPDAPAIPGEKKQIILDDRAFYDARNARDVKDPGAPGA